jgi:hypothetical protein
VRYQGTPFPYLAQEEIIPDDAFGELQLTLRGLEIKLDVRFLEELGDRVRILTLPTARP